MQKAIKEAAESIERELERVRAFYRECSYDDEVYLIGKESGLVYALGVLRLIERGSK